MQQKSYLGRTKCAAISYDGNAAIMMLMCMCRREYTVISARGDRQGERKRGNRDNGDKTEGERGQEVTQKIRVKTETTAFPPIHKMQ